jgi:hypothetical protein
MVEVGDRVVVESEKVGTVTRGGVVMAVEGRLIAVRWDSGSESVFIPSADRCGSPATSRSLGRSTAPKPTAGAVLRRPRRLTSLAPLDRVVVGPHPA